MPAYGGGIHIEDSLEVAMQRIFIFTVLFALCAGANAQNASIASGAGAKAGSGVVSEDGKEREDAVTDRTCLRETGSRIRTSTATDTRGSETDADRRGCLGANGRSYSRDDIRRTGEVDLGDALRRLDPSIH